jgi:LPXTG-motif cell wall-anchored protein
MISSRIWSRDGYSFAGWNTAADGTGTSYADSASFPFSASTALYALWTPTASNNPPANSAPTNPAATPPAPVRTLATTGADFSWLLFAGLTAVVVGSTLLTASRRKRV